MVMVCSCFCLDLVVTLFVVSWVDPSGHLLMYRSISVLWSHVSYALVAVDLTFIFHSIAIIYTSTVSQ